MGTTPSSDKRGVLFYKGGVFFGYITEIANCSTLIYVGQNDPS